MERCRTDRQDHGPACDQKGFPRRAGKAGADTVQISNHEGLALDSTSAAITGLPEIVQAVQGDVLIAFPTETAPAVLLIKDNVAKI